MISVESSATEECCEPSGSCQGISHCLESGHPVNCNRKVQLEWPTRCAVLPPCVCHKHHISTLVWDSVTDVPLCYHSDIPRSSQKLRISLLHCMGPNVQHRMESSWSWFYVNRCIFTEEMRQKQFSHFCRSERDLWHCDVKVALPVTPHEDKLVAESRLYMMFHQGAGLQS